MLPRKKGKEKKTAHIAELQGGPCSPWIVTGCAAAAGTLATPFISAPAQDRSYALALILFICRICKSG